MDGIHVIVGNLDHVLKLCQKKNERNLLQCSPLSLFCFKVVEGKYKREIFEAVSGLKENWRKSNISPIKEVSSIQTLAGILG